MSGLHHKRADLEHDAAHPAKRQQLEERLFTSDELNMISDLIISLAIEHRWTFVYELKWRGSVWNACVRLVCRKWSTLIRPLMITEVLRNICQSWSPSQYFSSLSRPQLLRKCIGLCELHCITAQQLAALLEHPFEYPILELASAQISGSQFTLILTNPHLTQEFKINALSHRMVFKPWSEHDLAEVEVPNLAVLSLDELLRSIKWERNPVFFSRYIRIIPYIQHFVTLQEFWLRMDVCRQFVYRVWCRCKYVPFKDCLTLLVDATPNLDALMRTLLTAACNKEFFREIVTFFERNHYEQLASIIDSWAEISHILKKPEFIAWTHTVFDPNGPYGCRPDIELAQPQSEADGSGPLDRPGNQTTEHAQAEPE